MQARRSLQPDGVTPPARTACRGGPVRGAGDALLSPSVTWRLVESYVRLPPPGEGVPEPFPG
jgi:hypothetical protein